MDILRIHRHSESLQNPTNSQTAKVIAWHTPPKAFQSMEHMSAMSGAFGGAKMSGQDNLSRHQSSSRHVKDANVGKDVVVIKGAYKGYLAQVCNRSQYILPSWLFLSQ